MRQFAGDYYSDHGQEIPIHILVDKLAEFAQLYTQEAQMMTLCSISLYYDERGPQIFEVDHGGVMLDVKLLQQVKNNKELLIIQKEK